MAEWHDYQPALMPNKRKEVQRLVAVASESLESGEDFRAAYYLRRAHEEVDQGCLDRTHSEQSFIELKINPAVVGGVDVSGVRVDASDDANGVDGMSQG